MRFYFSNLDELFGIINPDAIETVHACDIIKLITPLQWVLFLVPVILYMAFTSSSGCGVTTTANAPISAPAPTTTSHADPVAVVVVAAIRFDALLYYSVPAVPQRYHFISGDMVDVAIPDATTVDCINHLMSFH